MAATHAETLVSLLEFLNYLDDRFGSLLKANRAQIAKADASIAGTFAQIAGRRD